MVLFVHNTNCHFRTQGFVSVFNSLAKIYFVPHDLNLAVKHLYLDSTVLKKIYREVEQCAVLALRLPLYALHPNV